MSVEAVFKVIAYGVPALLILGGIVLLVMGYPLDHRGMILGGWGLIIGGGAIYILEIIVAAYLESQS